MFLLPVYMHNPYANTSCLIEISQKAIRLSSGPFSCILEMNFSSAINLEE